MPLPLSWHISHFSEHDSSRSVSYSIQIIFRKFLHTHLETSRRFVAIFVGSVVVGFYLWLLNINRVAMVFDINSHISEAKQYEINILKICDIGFSLNLRVLC